MSDSENNDVHSNTRNSNAHDDSDFLPLTLLFKFIRPFNGDRKELATFIQNCNSAFQMAQPSQVDKLFLYVAAQLSSNVVNEIDIEEISSWTQLKLKLRSFYSQIKDLTQLHEELETIKQNSHESVTDFYKRLEKLKNECISAETNQCECADELPSLKRSIQRTALRRFILHCKPEISQMLRARDIKTLNEAFSIALQEEKILNYTKTQTKPKHSSQYCSFCKTNTHTTQNCRKKLSSHTSSSPNTHSRPFSSYDPSKFCNYCKNKGHDISECRKRQFHNQQRQNNDRNPRDPRINHLNFNQSLEENAIPEDSQIQQAFSTLSTN